MSAESPSIYLPQDQAASFRGTGDEASVDESEMLPAHRSDYLIFLPFAAVSLLLVFFGIWKAMEIIAFL